MGRPKTVTDDHVLSAARRVFQERGHAATTRDVARAAGISQAVLYQRFATKDQLFLAAMVPARLDVGLLIGNAGLPSREDTEAHVREISRRLIAYLQQVGPALLHLSTHPVLRPEMIREGHAHLGADDVPVALARHLGELSQKGLLNPNLKPQAAAGALIALAHGVALQDLLTAGNTNPVSTDTFDAVFDVLWTGIQTGSN